MFRYLEDIETQWDSAYFQGEDPMDWDIYLKVENGIFHSPECNDLTEASEETALSLRDLIGHRPEEKCLKDVIILRDTDIFTFSTLAFALSSVSLACDWSHLSAETLKEAKVFYKEVSNFFDYFTSLGANTISPIVLEWLHLNRGYPSTSLEVITQYNQKVKKVVEENHQELLVETFNEASKHRPSWEKDTNINLDPWEEHQSQLARDARTVYPLTDTLSEDKVHDLSELALINELKKFNPSLKEIIPLTPILADVASWSYFIRAVAMCKLSWAPTAEDALTAATLFAQGMKADEAFSTSRKLK